MNTLYVKIKILSLDETFQTFEIFIRLMIASINFIVIDIRNHNE